MKYCCFSSSKRNWFNLFCCTEKLDCSRGNFSKSMIVRFNLIIKKYQHTCYVKLLIKRQFNRLRVVPIQKKMINEFNKGKKLYLREKEQIKDRERELLRISHRTIYNAMYSHIYVSIHAKACYKVVFCDSRQIKYKLYAEIAASNYAMQLRIQKKLQIQ